MSPAQGMIVRSTCASLRRKQSQRMKIPVVYELNGQRRCLLAQDGQTISIGRSDACSIQLEGNAVQEVELTAQFVNSCQFVVVHPANGSVPYAQPLPWKLTLGGIGLELLRPVQPAKNTAVNAGRELAVHGVAAAETHLLLPGQPLLLGSSQACDVVISDAGCPAVLLALWAAAGSKVLVQVLDSSAMVGWLGRTTETEAELEPPISLSIGGRVILLSSGGSSAVPGIVSKPAAPALAPLPKGAAILAKNSDAAPKIVSRQARPPEGGEVAEHLVRKPAILPSAYASSPAPLPLPTGVSPAEDLPPLPDPAAGTPPPSCPTLFILASWLLVALTFAVTLLPQQVSLTPEQLRQLWYAAGGMLIFTLLLGLGVLLK